jgi:cytochrome bd-type quinol oxidase subunit 2
MRHPATLVVIGGVFGEAAFRFAPPSLLGAAFKTFAVLVGTVWVTVMAFSLKVADLTDLPGLTVDEHRRLDERAREAIRRVWLYAGLNVLAAIFTLAPTVFAESRHVSYEWMAICAGMAVGFAAYSTIRCALWQDEFRELRSSLRLRERERAHQELLLKSIAHPTSADDANATAEAIARLNRRGTWPSH